MPSTLVRSAATSARSTSAATAPPDRDRFVDLLRVLAIAIVVLEHWLFPVLAYDAGTRTLAVGHALSTPGAWATTWIGQVMPLVFFAGGAANATSWQRRRGPVADRAWLTARVRRLAWPLLALAAVWLPLPHLLVGLGVPAQPVDLAGHLAGQLVWFLAVYLAAVVLTPVMLRLHTRWGLGVLVALAGGAVLVDVLRFTIAEPIGYLNLALVWLAVHQVGFLRATGALAALRGRQALRLAGVGFAATALLVTLGPYPATMIGLPGAETSNANPPTIALLTLGVGQLGLVLALEPWLLQLADRPAAARALAWAGPRTMSIYLWHMPALAVVAGIAVVGLGVSTPTPGSETWWLGLPVWIALLVATLRLLLRVVARFERPPERHGRTPSRAGVALAIALVGGGLVGVTVLGFASAMGSVLAVAAVAAGLHRLHGRQAIARPPGSPTVGLAPPASRQPAPWAAPDTATRLVA